MCIRDSLPEACEIKGFIKPPPLVQMVMEAVCLLLKEKTDWDSAKKVLGDSQFMNRLLQFDKDNIDPKIITKLQKYIKDDSFQVEAVSRGSKAATSLSRRTRCPM